MPSVLLVTQDLNRAGAQRQCVELALGLARRPGWSVEVAALEPDGPLAAELDAAGIRLHAVPRRWRWDLSPAAALADLTRDGRFDILHTFLFLPNFYGRVSRLRHRPPLVVSSLRSTGIEGLPRYVAEVLMAPLCDLIVANSEAGRRDLVRRGVAARRIAVVRNGLDLGAFAALPPLDGRPPAGPRIGMVAQMEPRKDHACLLAAFARLRTTHPRARLVLAGDGSRRRHVEAGIAALGLGASVEMPGTVGRSETVYAGLDLYVQASASQEGTSNSIIEAMAAARPVVATDIGGNAETVVHGETGLIVPPRDLVALAEAMAALIDDRDRARTLGLAARARALGMYTRERMVAATVQAYEEALAAPSRHGTGGAPAA
jgi:glycosyltransferase involved in cell wall biosynthesis